MRLQSRGLYLYIVIVKFLTSLIKNVYVFDVGVSYKNSTMYFQVSKNVMSLNKKHSHRDL